MERAVNPLFARREYAQALTQLASLRDDVDRFFDSVMVMAEDATCARTGSVCCCGCAGCSCSSLICRALPG